MHMPNDVVDTTCRTGDGAEAFVAHAAKLNAAATHAANQVEMFLAMSSSSAPAGRHDKAPA